MDIMSIVDSVDELVPADTFVPLQGANASLLPTPVVNINQYGSDSDAEEPARKKPKKGDGKTHTRASAWLIHLEQEFFKTTTLDEKACFDYGIAHGAGSTSSQKLRFKAAVTKYYNTNRALSGMIDDEGLEVDDEGLKAFFKLYNEDLPFEIQFHLYFHTDKVNKETAGRITQIFKDRV